MLFKCGGCVFGCDRWSSALQMCVDVLFFLCKVVNIENIIVLNIENEKKVRNSDWCCKMFQAYARASYGLAGHH